MQPLKNYGTTGTCPHHPSSLRCCAALRASPHQAFSSSCLAEDASSCSPPECDNSATSARSSYQMELYAWQSKKPLTSAIISFIFLVLNPEDAFTVFPCIGSQHQPTIKPDFLTAVIKGFNFKVVGVLGDGDGRMGE